MLFMLNWIQPAYEGVWRISWVVKRMIITTSVYVNKVGEVFLYGTTASDTGINIKSSSTKSNGTDVFITRFSKNNKLLWSKYLGGNSEMI
jgi:hypothetical protein